MFYSFGGVWDVRLNSRIASVRLLKRTGYLTVALVMFYDIIEMNSIPNERNGKVLFRNIIKNEPYNYSGIDYIL